MLVGFIWWPHGKLLSCKYKSKLNLSRLMSKVLHSFLIFIFLISLRYSSLMDYEAIKNHQDILSYLLCKQFYLLYRTSATCLFSFFCSYLAYFALMGAKFAPKPDRITHGVSSTLCKVTAIDTNKSGKIRFLINLNFQARGKLLLACWVVSHL